MKSGISQRQLTGEGIFAGYINFFLESNKNQVAIPIGARQSKIRSSSSKIILKQKESDWRRWRRINE